MKLTLSPSDIRRLEHLIEVKETNIQVADMYLYYLLEEPLFVTHTFEKAKVKPVDENDFFYRTLMKCLSVDLAETENARLAQTYFHAGIKKLDPTVFNTNPYYQLIALQSMKSGDWSFQPQEYQPYQGFAYDDIQVDPVDYREESPIGFFTQQYPFMAVFEKDTLWMSLIPHEMMTMEVPLQKMHGHVVVFGLGLGYFTYMASIKDNVQSVTVIEKDKALIHLFTSTLLPAFSQKEKITILEMDAFDYLKTMPQTFDAAFVDIYLGANDGLSPYLRFRANEHRFGATHFTYWLETSILAYFRRLVLVYLEEVLEKLDDSHYHKAKSDEDQIINALHRHFLPVTLRSYEQIHQLLSDASLISLAKTLKID